MPVVFRTYQGHGTFRFDFGLEVAADFKVTVRSDARIEAIFTVPVDQNTLQIVSQNQNRPKNPPEASLIGQVTSPSRGRVNATRLILSQFELQGTPQSTTLMVTMFSREQITIDFANLQQKQTVEVRHGLTNFIFGGCEISPTPTGSYRDTFRATLNGQLVFYRQLPSFRHVTQELGQDVILTSEAIVQIQLSDYERSKNVINDSLMLLSLASGNYIASIYEDTFHQGVLAKTILKPVKTMPYHHRDYCIDLKNLAACDLQIFLETTFPKYRTMQQDLGLDIVIEYYLQAKRAPLVELKYLIGVVGIECLLSYVPSYFSKIGKWKKGSGFVDLILSKLRRRPSRRSLRRKTQALLEHFSVSHNLQDLQFIKIRNRLVHTGRFPEALQKQPYEPYTKLMSFLDRILLTILGFRGHYYLNRLNNFQREILR